MENYFLIPEYAIKSRYLNVSEAALRRAILLCCQRRLFLDAANLVVVGCREAQKANWVVCFEKVRDFPTAQAALARLHGLKEFTDRRKAIAKQITKKALSRRFNEVLQRLTGGRLPLEYGYGRWLVLLQGKGVLLTVVQQCFRVSDAHGRPVQGRAKLNEIAKDLVRRQPSDQPADFQELRRLISEQAKL